MRRKLSLPPLPARVGNPHLPARIQGSVKPRATPASRLHHRADLGPSLPTIRLAASHSPVMCSVQAHMPGDRPRSRMQLSAPPGIRSIFFARCRLSRSPFVSATPGQSLCSRGKPSLPLPSPPCHRNRPLGVAFDHTPPATPLSIPGFPLNISILEGHHLSWGLFSLIGALGNPSFEIYGESG